MAAPSGNAASSKCSDNSANLDGKLDLTSPSFDPIAALRSKDINLPCPDVTPFDNLAAYENCINPKLSKTKQNIDKTQQSESGSKFSCTSREKKSSCDISVELDIASKLSEIRVDVEDTTLSIVASKKSEKTNKKEIDFEDEKYRKERESLAAKRKKRNRNVVTRMHDYEKGPLHFLKRCMENRHVVKVWTRSASEWRGFCTGYIVAFDRHFNLAMMDVDETYKKPRARDRRSEFQSHATDSIVKTEGNGTELNINKPDNKSSSQSDTLSSHMTKLDLQDKDHRSAESSESKPDINQPSEIDKKPNTDNSKLISSEQNKENNEKCKLRTSDKVKKDCDSSDNSSDESDKSCNQKKDQTCSVVPNTSKKSKRVIPLEDCTSLKLLHRHVNQLFIRGDNVASIGILYY